MLSDIECSPWHFPPTHVKMYPGVASQVAEVVDGDVSLGCDIESVGVDHHKLHTVGQTAVEERDHRVLELRVQGVSGVDDDVWVVDVWTLGKKNTRFGKIYGRSWS